MTTANIVRPVVALRVSYEIRENVEICHTHGPVVQWECAVHDSDVTSVAPLTSCSCEPQDSLYVPLSENLSNVNVKVRLEDWYTH